MKRNPQRAATFALMLLAAGLWVAAIATVFLAPDIYEATARIQIEKDKPDTDEFGTGCIEDGWVPAQVERLQSKSVLSAVITNLDLQRQWSEKFKESEPIPLPRACALLRRQTSVALGRGTALFEIHVRSEEPSEAARIANTIAVTYREQRIARWTAMSWSSIKSMQEELAKKEEELKLLEDKANRLRVALGISEAEATTMESSKTNHLDARSSFFEVRRNVEALKLIRERMNSRIWQDRVAVAMHGSTVEIIEAADPAMRPLPPDYRRASIFFGAGVLSALLGVLAYRRSLDVALGLNTPPASAPGSGGSSRGR